MYRALALATAAFSIALASSPALGEGTDDLNIHQGLFADTEIFVDIANASREQICWTGRGGAEVIDDDGASLGAVASGDCVNATPGVSGVYQVVLDQDQLDYTGSWSITVTATYEWDIAVRDRTSGVETVGRVWSDAWQFGSRGFAEEYAVDGSFYARVPGGLVGEDAVVELRLEGLSGYVYTVLANRTGVEGDNAGRSVPQDSGTIVYREYPLYLNPPDLASYTSTAPAPADFRFSGGATGCDEIAPGEGEGTFAFESNVEGTYHVVCDLDSDGDFYGPNDLLLVRSAEIGLNELNWNGLDNSGDPVAGGNYDCQVRLSIGEFHYIGIDIETSFPGMRMFEVDAFGDRRPLMMRWDDTLVQDNAVAMPNGDTSPALSPLLGLDSEGYSVPPAPHGETTAGNARAWGAFLTSDPLGKGNEAYLDTYAWLDTALSGTITITVVDSGLDADGDGLSDYVEECALGTNPNDPDTDHDSIGDYEETNGGSPIDTDGDGDIDALDHDTDDDGLSDADEAGDDDITTPAVDTDDDGIGDWRDHDSDGDGDGDDTDCAPLDPDIHTGAEERCNGLDDNCNGAIDEGLPDTDGDGVPDCLDDDSDGDGDPNDTDCAPDDPDVFHGQTEFCNGIDDDCDGEIDEGFEDFDGDGEADCDEVDTDEDGDPDSTDCDPADPDIHHGAEEVCDGEDNDCDGETDEGLLNDCGECGETPEEVCDGEDNDCDGEIDEGFDEDGNGIGDCLEEDSDGDGIPDMTEDEWGTDPHDADSDDDGVPDGEEGNPDTGHDWNDDSDGDGSINALDPDSDDDGILDGTETGRTEPDGDTDLDVGNFVPDEDPDTTTDPTDPDTDGGTVSDGDEDVNHDGEVDEGERDPNDWTDDNPGLAGGGCACQLSPGSSSGRGASLLFALALLGLALLRRSHR